MFSQACVKNSVHRGEGVWQTPPRQTPLSPGRHPQADTPQADTPSDRHTPQADTPLTPHPQQTATAVDGTHPTGMHSCLTGNIKTIADQFMLSPSAIFAIC